MDPHMNVTVGRLQVLAAALLFSTGGAGLKTPAFSVAQVSALRSGIAALVLLLWIRGRIKPTPAMFAAAVSYALTVTLFVAANRLTTAGSAIFLQSTAPLFIAVLGPILLGERLLKRDLPYLAAMAVGLAVCLVGLPESSATAPDPATGNVLALACSLTWAFTLMSLRYLNRGHATSAAGLAAVAMGNVLAWIGAMPFAWPFPAAPALDWMTAAYLGVFQIGAAYVCLTAAVRRLPALEVSLILLIEPVLNPVWTWIVRGEAPGQAVMAGGGVILAAAATRALRVEPVSRRR